MEQVLDFGIAQLTEDAIDDLTKYNVIRFLYEHPAFSGDVDCLGSSIGLTAGRRLAEAVRDLAGAGLLSIALAENGSPLVTSALQGRQREGVGRLLSLSPESAEFAVLLRRLTARSLKLAVGHLLSDL